MSERTIIVDALLKVAVLFITAIIIPSLKEWIERNRDNKELQLVLMMADVAVRSVENDLKTEIGHKKKAEAVRRLSEQIESFGLKGFTDTELNHYIETAVTAMWNDEPLKVIATE